MVYWHRKNALHQCELQVTTTMNANQVFVAQITVWIIYYNNMVDDRKTSANANVCVCVHASLHPLYIYISSYLQCVQSGLLYKLLLH